MATHSSVIAWRIPRQRSLVGYSPCGNKESDMTEQLTLFLDHQCFKCLLCGRDGLGAGQVPGKKADKNTCHHGAYVLMELKKKKDLSIVLLKRVIGE